MKAYLIEPKAPLVFRSGKPFGTATTVDGAALPLPSSIAGLMRTAYADEQGLDFNDSENIKKLKSIAIKGPLFLKKLASKQTLLVPKPADAIYMKNPVNDTLELHQLSPEILPAGCGSDLPEDLLHVTLTSGAKGKPGTGTKFWSLESLRKFGDQDLSYESVHANGFDFPTVNHETHVALDKKTGATDPGRLFQLASIDLNAKQRVNSRKSDASAWAEEAFAIATLADIDVNATGVVLGGERRLSTLSPINSDNPRYLSSRDVFEACLQKGGVKITLLTPALFENGYRPNINGGLWTPLDQFPEFQLRLRAVAIERFVPVSGWDLQKNAPKTTRKACPAGSVFWFSIANGASIEALETLDFSNISDLAQDRNDGFGLVTLSPWKNI